MPTSRGFLLSLMPSSPSLEMAGRIWPQPGHAAQGEKRTAETRRHGDTKFEFSPRVLRASVVISISLRHEGAHADDRLDDIDGGGDRREGVCRRRRAGGSGAA